MILNGENQHIIDFLALLQTFINGILWVNLKMCLLKPSSLCSPCQFYDNVTWLSFLALPGASGFVGNRHLIPMYPRTKEKMTHQH